MKALIGHTGFVGSNILKKADFDLLYNSENISDIHNQNLQMLVCAGAPGSMAEANKNKNFDRQNIDELVKSISKSRSQRLILISTIGVFEDFSAFNDETSEDFEMALAYGANRRYLEESIKNSATKTHIIRLPSLFGKGLKKNFIFDLLNPVPSFLTIEKFEQLEFLISHEDKKLLKFYEINLETGFFNLNRKLLNVSSTKDRLVRVLNDMRSTSIFFHSHKTTYQFYNLNNLWSDISKIIQNDIDIMHLSTEPVSTSDIFESFFFKDMPITDAHIHNENMISKNSHFWDSKNGFIKSKEEVLDQLSNFYLNESNK